MEIAVLGFTCIRSGERVFLLGTHVAGNTPENVGADGIGTAGRWRCTRRKDKPRDHSNMDWQRVLQIDHRLSESHSHYDSLQSHRMLGLSKQNLGEAASGMGALDWERLATGVRDGLTVST